jgi:hypothetical protein
MAEGAKAVVCTLSTINTIKDLKVFLFTLELFNTNKPKVYLLCDTETAKLATDLYKGELVIDTGLDRYGDVNRKRMTGQRGAVYKTLWEDFMMEKASVMDLAFETESAVFFFDSDICFLGQLPQIPPNKKIAVSPHMIKPIDEERYGKFNAGFLWTNDKNVPKIWRQASKTSRFYDQAALEDVVKVFQQEEVYNFPIQNNYGWWRMYQSTEPSITLQKNWAMFRNETFPSVGIRVDDSALLSIHTHWSEIVDLATSHFNLFVFSYLTRLGKYSHAQALTRFLQKEFPHLETK